MRFIQQKNRLVVLCIAVLSDVGTTLAKWRNVVLRYIYSKITALSFFQLKRDRTILVRKLTSYSL